MFKSYLIYIGLFIGGNFGKLILIIKEDVGS